MIATDEEVAAWFDESKALGATHMLIVYDDYTEEDFPLLVYPHRSLEAAKETVQATGSQKVLAIYSLEKDFAPQIKGA